MLREALDEDLGTGDVTTERIVPRRLKGRARLVAKADGVFCGAPVAERLWRMVSRKTEFQWLVAEGESVSPGQEIAEIEGPYGALLVGERIALNFLQRLSGVATATRQLVDAAGGEAGPAIYDTRKTTPLWRTLERYAVRAGGGHNHRFGLFDMILIKENHARAAGGLAEAIAMAKSEGNQNLLRIGAEARDMGEVAEAFEAGADLILLDNMSPAQIRRVTKRYGGRGVPLEISGGVSMKNIRAYAAAGADRISVGGITHSAPALDLSLQIYRTDEPRRADEPRQRAL